MTTPYKSATTKPTNLPASPSVRVIVTGGGTGWAVDSATGTANRYDSQITIPLAPVPGPPP